MIYLPIMQNLQMMVIMESRKKKLSIIVFSIFLVPLLTNCAKNGYIEFYENAGNIDERLNKNINPKVYGTSRKNFDEDIKRVRRDKYYVIGGAFFTGTSGSADDPKKAAIEKDADIVLYYKDI